MRRALILIALAGLLAAPGAAAQGPAPPPPEPAVQPVIDVQRVIVPSTRGKLVSRGVTVQASCTPDCLLVLRVSVPKGAARRMGLKGRVIGSAIAAAASGVPAFIRAPVRRGARGPLLEFEGSARLQVRVTALP
jgi:hypothetical protein